MSVLAEARARPAVAAVGEVRASRRLERATRALLQRILLFPMVSWFCRPLVVRGSVPDGPVVFAVNHSSHADTAVLLRALPHRVRAHTTPAAAEDYWFAGRVRALVARIVIGAFPFPRRGSTGLVRAAAQLDHGCSVVLFPEGTRSTDGRVGPFKPGVGILSRAGATIVPVAIAGTADVFPKKARFPRRAPVVVSFGEPIAARAADPCSIAAEIGQRVRSLHRRAALTRPLPRPTTYARARAFARSPAALLVAFCWGVAEALWLPIVPDVGIALLALAAPARALPLAAASIAGSLTGGAFAYAIGPAPLAHVPLVTGPMADAARGWLADEGARGVARQPWSGVPFKAFGYQAAGTGVPLGGFLAQTFVARGLRFAQVGILFAVAGRAGRRIAPRAYVPVTIALLGLFASGLARVVASWS